MKMTDLPALPKGKPLNRRIYDLAWAPFGAILALGAALAAEAKAGFLVSALLTIIVLGFSAVAGDLDGARAVFLLVGFLGLGIVLTLVFGLISGVRKLFN